MSKATRKKKQPIAISELALNLGLIDADIESWLSESTTKKEFDYRKRPSVSADLPLSAEEIKFLQKYDKLFQELDGQLDGPIQSGWGK